MHVYVYVCVYAYLHEHVCVCVNFIKFKKLVICDKDNNLYNL